MSSTSLTCGSMRTVRRCAHSACSQGLGPKWWSKSLWEGCLSSTALERPISLGACCCTVGCSCPPGSLSVAVPVGCLLLLHTCCSDS